MSAKTIEIGKGHPTNLDANYSLDWLADTDALQTSTGSEFGRNIESYIETIKTSHAPIRLNVRKRPAAVVIGIDEYEEMLSMKAQFANLVVRVREAEIAQAGNEFDALFARISSAHSRKMADALHNVTTEELANSYKPGRTERN
jgi:prevent-host-death family protein